MEDLILIKLGGSLITDKSKPFTPRMDVIKRLASEIHEAREKGAKLIVAHGGGSFPHRPAKEYRVNEGIINDQSYRGISLVQDAASRLNRIIVGALIEAGENAVSVQPSAGLVAEDGRIKGWCLEPLKEMLKYNLLPVPYGDVAFDTKRGCSIISTEEIINYLTSHEKILDYLSTQYRCKKIILAGVTDGVFTADPQKDPSAKPIPEINSSNYEDIRKYLGGSADVDVTGGMVDKVAKVFELARLGVEANIIGGLKEGNLRRAIMGEKGIGTTVRA